MKEKGRCLVIHGIEKQHTPLSGKQNHSARPAVTSQGTRCLSAVFWGKRKQEVQGYQHPVCHWGSTTKVNVPAGQFWRAGCGKHSLRVHPSLDIAHVFSAANLLAHNLEMPMAALAPGYMHGMSIHWPGSCGHTAFVKGNAPPPAPPPLFYNSTSSASSAARTSAVRLAWEEA